MALVRNRDISIDIMKCLAVILVMNSHMDLLYGKYSALATGGAIGDVLFFFASGYTILLGRGGNFFNWYKRRINRIYPTVFAMAIISAFFLGSKANMQGRFFRINQNKLNALIKATDKDMKAAYEQICKDFLIGGG